MPAAAPDLFGILDAVKKLTAPAGMEAVHVDGFSWPRNGLTYGDSTKLTPDDWSRIIGNLRGLLIGSGVDLNTLDPTSPLLLRDVLVNYIIAELADVLPDYIDDNAATIAADIIADPTFAGVLASAIGALSFKFATATADADPGAGNFRLNNASPASATAAFIDNADAYGATVSGALDKWDDSTNTIRGTLTLGPATNPAVRYTFNVTGAVVDGTGYRKLTLAYVSGSGAIASGASCWLVFNRTGDKGLNGTGDFSGPAASVVDRIVTFADATGKLGKDSGVLIGDLAPKASPTFTGTPAAPTAAPGTNTTQIATTGFVKAAIDVVLGGVSTAFDTLSEIATAIGLLAPKANPTFTGTVTVPAGSWTFASLAAAAVATAAELASFTASKLVSADVVLSAMSWFGMTDAATITVNHASGVNQKVTLGGNRAFGTPTNAKIGMPLNIWVVQDATGTRVPTWAAEFDFGDFGTPAGSTGAAQADLYCFVCLTTSKYAFLGLRKRVD